MLFALSGVATVVVLMVVYFAASYKIVGPNEAHIVVFMGRGRTVKTPVNGGKTSYFFFPLLMKRFIVPLTNVKLDIMNIPLNDMEMAPFLCDVITWLHISDPVKAAERLDFSSGNVFQSFHQDLINIVQAIARAAAMKQEILDIMRDRSTFAKGVTAEVDPVLESWGVQLVNLEVNDIRDANGSQVISNYEAIRKAQIQSLARIQVAQRDREAVEAEQTNRQKAEIAKADAEKNFTSAQIDRDTTIGIKTQEKEQQVAVAAAKTNEQKVSALRVSTVGQASVAKDAAITTAEGEGEAIRIKGEKEANVTTLKGQAAGNAIEAQGLAEAKVKDAMALALQKYNDAATVIEKIRASVDIQTAFAQAYAEIAKNAEIKIVTGGQGGNIMGLPMNAETGANFGQMLNAMGVDTDKIISAIGK